MDAAIKFSKYKLLNFILLTAIIINLLWFFGKDLIQLGKLLFNDEDFSFGLLIPFIVIAIIYLKRSEIVSHPMQPSWWGLFIMFLGYILYAFGELMAIIYFPPVAFLVVIAGLLILLGGWGFFRLFAFPLFLLYLIIPWPSLVMAHLSFPLQLLSSRLTAATLSAMGYVVYLQGNVIDLGGRTLQVVDACSGLRYVFNFIMLGSIFCYFYQRTPWKIAVIILSLIPAAVLGNVIRLVTIGVFPTFQEGFWHLSLGLSIFILAFDYLKLINWITNKIQPPRLKTTLTLEKTSPEEDFNLNSQSAPYYPKYLLAALALAVTFIPITLGLAKAPPVHILKNFDDFSMKFDSWQGKRQYLDKEMEAKVGADDYLNATFTDPDHGSVSVWIAFFKSQDKKIGGGIHSPQVCLPGSGWKTIESKIIELAPGRPVRFLLIEKEGQREAMIYWYYQRGRWVASEYFSRFYMGWDGLFKRRNDGAIIRFGTRVDKDIDLAQKKLINFANLVVPLLNEFIPN